MHARLRGPNNLFIIKSDFPRLADEIAKPRPDIKFAAFSVSEESFNIHSKL